MNSRTNGQRAALTVQDEGPGIPAEVREHIFDRFYRASEDPAVPGFGLGLSIAKALVEAQGGGITVDSEVGKGSRVVVELELCAAQSG